MFFRNRESVIIKWQIFKNVFKICHELSHAKQKRRGGVRMAIWDGSFLNMHYQHARSNYKVKKNKNMNQNGL